MKQALLLLFICLFAVSCGRSTANEKRYDLKGKVVVVEPEKHLVTVAHEDVKGFMPAMTMPFRVESRAQLDTLVPGELIRATLVVGDREVHLKDVERTGAAPLTEAPPRTFDLLDPGEAVPDEPFVDQSGTSRRLSDWRGKAVAVTFIYTRCPLPDFCPRMDQHFSAVQKEVVADPALRERVHLVSISFDPSFDRPAVLKAHAARAGASAGTWSFVTGDQEDIDRFASRFGVSTVREDATAQEIVHNLRTAVIDPQGRLVKVFRGNDWKPAELLHELRASIDTR
jgi:protein SCO1/2